MTDIKIKNPAAPVSPDLQPYLRANLIVWALVLVTAAAAFFICGGVWDDVTSGTEEFILCVLGGGFTLVSFLDFIYEKFSASFSGGEKKP